MYLYYSSVTILLEHTLHQGFLKHRLQAAAAASLGNSLNTNSEDGSLQSLRLTSPLQVIVSMLKIDSMNEACFIICSTPRKIKLLRICDAF